MSTDSEQLDWFRENLPAYIASGLSPDERNRIDELARENDTCRTDLEELMALDASLTRAAGVANIVDGLESRVIAAIDRRRFAIHPLVRRAALATAACIVLGGFGYIGSQQMQTNQLWGWRETGTDEPLMSFDGLNPFIASRRAQYSVQVKASEGQIAGDVGPDDARGVKGSLERWSEVKERGKDTNGEFITAFSSDFSTGAEVGKEGVRGTRIIRNGVQNQTLHEAGNFEALTKVGDGDLDGKKGESYSLTNGDSGTRTHRADGQAFFDPSKVMFDMSSSMSPLTLGGARDVVKGMTKQGVGSTGGTLNLNGGAATNSEKMKEVEKLTADLKKSTDELAASVANGGTLVIGGQALPMNPVTATDSVPVIALADGDKDSPGPPGPSGPPTAPADTGRKIIRSGEMEFEVDRFDSAAAVISKIAGEEKGFVATTASDKLANGKVRGQMIVRIPPDRLDAFVLQLRALGDLKSQRIGSADVSKEYTDLESELRAGRAMEERLLDMIKNGKGEIKDLLEAEKELANWRGKIEKIIGQMKFYDNQVALSTLAITLTERDLRTAAATVEQETISAGVETDDVEKARTAALAMLGEAKARIVSADLKKLDAGQMAATIVADIPGDSGPVIDRIKLLGKVARLEAAKSQTADPNNPSTPTTKVEKRDARLTLSLYNVANVAPRQTTLVELAVNDTSAAYAAIVAKVTKAGGRVVAGASAQGRSNNSRADAKIEVPAGEADAFVADLKALGEIVTQSTSEANDTASVTTSKRGFSLMIYPVTALDAKQRVSMRIETADVEQASADLQALVLAAGGRVVDSSSTTEPAGGSTATLAVELPLAKSADAIAAVRKSGKVLAASTTQNANAASGAVAKSRFDLTITTPGPITGDTGGLMANLRNGLAFSLKGLLYSLQLVVIGLCFVLPWLLVLWVGVKLWKRRKPTVTPTA